MITTLSDAVGFQYYIFMRLVGAKKRTCIYIYDNIDNYDSPSDDTYGYSDDNDGEILCC